MKQKIAIEIISILFMILFLYTGLSKLMEYSIFKEQIATSPILAPASNVIAVVLPVLEIAIVVLLLIPHWRLIGLNTSLVIMVIFTVYIGAILAFNKDLPCSCGGVIGLLSWPQHLIFNGVFILLAIGGIMIERKLRRQNKLI